MLAALCAATTLAPGLSPAAARPVSYPGGWTLIQTNDGTASGLNVHFTPSPNYAVGVYVERNRVHDYDLLAGQVNWLVHRWNGPQSQANLYLKGGVGLADGFGQNAQADGAGAGYLIASADWETRRWFVMAETKATEVDGVERSVVHRGRLGVAPYIGEYGDLHTWLMLQVENDPAGDEPVRTTPLVRLFYGVMLLEAGYTLETDTGLFNLIWRF
jgi:hypothetical protein